MIAQRITNHNAIETNEVDTIQAFLAMRGQIQMVKRWACDMCGMVHTGQMPQECESCGHQSFVQQADIHREMNNHW